MSVCSKAPPTPNRFFPFCRSGSLEGDHGMPRGPFQHFLSGAKSQFSNVGCGPYVFKRFLAPPHTRYLQRYCFACGRATAGDRGGPRRSWTRFISQHISYPPPPSNCHPAACIALGHIVRRRCWRRSARRCRPTWPTPPTWARSTSTPPHPARHAPGLPPKGCSGAG